MGSRREFLTAAAAFAAGTVTVGTAGAAEQRPEVVTLLNGRHPPRRSQGIVGDFYIDDSTHAIYGPKRQELGWGKPTSLIGRAGARGPAGAQGPAGLQGSAGSSGSTGSSGTEVGATGPAGPQGPQGYSILHGSGPPAASLGEDNDFYIDTSATQLYGPREGGVWGSPVSLSGAANINSIDGGTL